MSATTGTEEKTGGGGKATLVVRHRGLLTLAVMAGTVMQILDTTIANVALPHMQASLGATQETITWVLTSYIIASAVAIPITGWLADRVGLRRLFLFSVGLFVVASMLCGISTSLTEMVIFRLFQGIAGAFIAPLAQTIMLDINPPEQHGKAMSIYGMGIMIGPVMGPILGGWLTENFSWRWVFYVNLPVGLLCLILLWALLPARPVTKRSFDLFGFALLAVALGALQLMLDRGVHLSWFDSTEVWIEAGIAAAAFWMFIIHLATGRNPIFRPAMLADRNLLTGTLFLFIIGLVALASMALLPPMLQGIYNYPVLDTGLLLATRGLGVFVTMAIAGRVLGKVDTRLLALIGFLLLAVSLYSMTGWSLNMDWKPIVTSGIIQGLGLGFLFVPINVMAFATLPSQYRTEAAGLLNLTRNMGSSIGISIVTALLARNLQISHSDLASHVTQFNLPVDPNMALRGGESGDALMTMIDLEIGRQAAMIAYLDDFSFMMWASIAAIPLILLLRAPKPKQGGEEEDLHFAME
ncbi:DHA2 family efflux MFS transporter permease subunit [Rhizorhapis suberifaciens]|uniref:DHA2 family multidrug resistance protein n=1 Tax=Rhizorhapis suberifaciens TaxID=13656 RepID=A0A840HVQ3_9SPHN|nr:DHA2 family efflux MFS transporter permease subunit [Rhizorhapis suberifaciens]MBB4641697.1 DHA2 family multidrug resistance protein [Rhizorhapis suberifaciens]